MLVMLLSLLTNDPIKVRKINTAKAEAKDAFNAGDYKGAIAKYKYLIDSLEVKEDEIFVNLANAYYLEKDTANATTTYQSLTSSSKNEIRSKSHQQLGAIANQQGKFEQALQDFKQSIKANPANNDARYNYEMLKKKLDDQKKQEQQDKQNKDEKKDDQKKDDKQNKDDQKKEQEKKDQQKEQEKKEQEKKDQEKKDQEQKDQQNKEEKSEEQKEKQEQEKQSEQQEKEKKEQQKKSNFDAEKFPEISQEKAEMILEAMKNQEKQYLQQQKRKATKSKDKNKPDW
jgi:hypothetical protein